MLNKIRKLFGRRKKPAADSDLTRPPVHHGPKVAHQPISNSDLDPDAVKIVQRLTRFDHNAYFVGGCVRDLLLDRHPKDFDIGTSATPRQIKRLFRNSRIIGRRFRLAHIYFQNGKIIEVATFRSRNGSDSDSTDDGSDLLIRDDNEFGTPEEDALRRDFTINALFYDLNDGNVLDYADGLADLRRKLVRTIGAPEVRFCEDPIRILRAIKFAARLGFEIETKTLEAIRRTRVEIPKAAAPRILEEINRYGRERAAKRSFELLRETGVFDVILPEFAKAYRDDSRWQYLLALLEKLDRRRIEGAEIAPGTLFAALLLPLMHETLGWNEERAVRVGEISDAIDNQLQEIALRLRIPRREQELCRQILTNLARMVPWSRVRPATRRVILRRVSLTPAMWLLQVAAERAGGEFSASFDEWTKAVADAPPPTEDGTDVARGGRDSTSRSRVRRRRGGRGRGPRAEGDGSRESRSSRKDSEESTGDEATGTTGRRRPRRRRGRGRRDGSDAGEGAAKPQTASAPSGSKGRSTAPKGSGGDRPPAERPERWDDDYFFAALPQAPEMEGDDRGDRYGARTVVPEGIEESSPPAEKPASDDAPSGGGATGDTEDGARPRRRRRRRRRGGARRSGAASSSEKDDTGAERASDGDDRGSGEES